MHVRIRKMGKTKRKLCCCVLLGKNCQEPFKSFILADGFTAEKDERTKFFPPSTVSSRVLD